MKALTFKRATALLELDRGTTLVAVATTLGVSSRVVATWRTRYTTRGLTCLNDAPRSGRPTVFDGVCRAKITALATSDAPEGYGRWSLRLLAEKAVESGICDGVSYTFVRDVLKKNELKPHLKQTWCIGKIDAAFLARLEHILWLYAQPYDPCYPVVCFDERPCFLIGDTLLPRPTRKGEIAKEHYEYKKLGSCVLLAAIEPLSGRRLGQVYDRRTKREFTQFCVALAAMYRDATKIRLVLDNLNTHNASSFYEHLPAEEAFALAQRFEFHYTPKGASWLNMIECEFSVISRQCLDRRIATSECLRREVLALLQERSAKAIKIHWQFSIQSARSTFNRHYTRVNTANQKPE